MPTPKEVKGINAPIHSIDERLAPHAAYTTTPKPETPPEQGSVKKPLRSIGERLAKIQ